MNESLLNLFDEPIYVSDLETYELYFMNDSCQRVIGFAGKNYVGMRCHKLLQNLDSPCSFCNNAQLREDSFLQWEYHNTHLDRHFEIRDKKCLWNGRYCRFEIARDITEEKRQEEQHRKSMSIALSAAQQAGRARTRFLSRVSHELRTPLNAILGMVNVAAAALDKPPLLREAHSKIEGSARYLLAQLNDILDVAHMESGSFGLSPEAFEFSDFLSELCSLYVMEARQNHLTFTATLDYFPAETLYADAHRLKQMLGGLLSNACKFTEPGGKVRLEIRPWRSNPQVLWLECVVSDTGIGISPEFMDKLFVPFEGEAEGGRGFSGMGLGLPISKKVADLMGGTLEIQSRQGQGTRCTVRVPLGVRRARRDCLPAESLQKMRAMRILAVDDAEGCRNLTQMLDSLGLAAHTVHSGVEGVECLKALHAAGGQYDLCVVYERIGDLAFSGFWDAVEAGLGVRKECCAVSMFSYVDAHEVMGQRHIAHFLGKPYLAAPLLDLLCAVHGLAPAAFQGESKGFDFSGKRLLLVEDNEINREVAFELLSKVGKFSVEMAQNGREAVAMFTAHEAGYYDLILMDICMPIMDGHEATRCIRAARQQGGDSVPIVALSANSNEEDKEKSRACGLNAHVAKPLDLDVLCPVLAQVLG